MSLFIGLDDGAPEDVHKFGADAANVPQQEHVVVDSIELTSFNGEVQDRFGIAGC
jgi:hypothetical protein